MKRYRDGRTLRGIVDGMTEMERYELLATLRTGEPVTREQQELRWYFMRMIMTRAYTRSYKHAYSVQRQWYEVQENRFRLVLSYEMETARILTLAEHIKKYKAPSKVRAGHTKDTAAVALALKSYFLRFVLYDVTILYKNKGVAFGRNYSRILEMDKYLRTNGWSPQLAINAWVRDKNADYDRYMDSGVKVLDANHKRPTPAMILGTYARFIRHATVYGVISSFSMDTTESEEDDDINPYQDAKQGFVAIHDVSVRYKQLIAEVSKIAVDSRRRKGDFY